MLLRDEDTKLAVESKNSITTGACSPTWPRPLTACCKLSTTSECRLLGGILRTRCGFEARDSYTSPRQLFISCYYILASQLFLIIISSKQWSVSRYILCTVMNAVFHSLCACDNNVTVNVNSCQKRRGGGHALEHVLQLCCPHWRKDSLCHLQGLGGAVNVRD